MKSAGFFIASVLAAALTLHAAPTCNTPQVVVGNNCVLTTNLGWITAGGGTQSVFTFFVPPNATGPVEIEVTNMKSSLGNSYSGYLGFIGGNVGQPPITTPDTLADIVAGGNDSIGQVPPGAAFQFYISKVCWDPTCTAAAPAGAVPNMLSLQLSFSSPVTTDINTNGVQLIIQFLDANGQVTFEEQEFPTRSNPQYSIVPGVDIGATPASRYVYNGAAVTKPFDVISISNLNNTNAISGTLTLKDFNGNPVATAPIPSIPVNGAAGYLVIGRTPGDTLGLLPSSTVLPAGADGIFHGSLEVHMTGQTVTGFCIVLAQEFNGNSMLNLPVFGGPNPIPAQ